MGLGEDKCPRCGELVAAEEICYHKMCCDCAQDEVERLRQRLAAAEAEMARRGDLAADLNKRLATAQSLLRDASDGLVLDWVEWMKAARAAGGWE